MEVDVKNLEVRNNEEASRFEVQLGEQIGMIEYRKEGHTYEIIHTEVPPEFGGRGIAERMAYGALETIKAEGAKALVYCPFVRLYVARHPEYQSIILGEDEAGNG